MYFPLFQLRGWDFRSGMPPKTIDSVIPKEALTQSARADAARFWHRRKFKKRRNTVCISRFLNGTDVAKDPACRRRRLIQRFLSKKGRASPPACPSNISASRCQPHETNFTRLRLKMPPQSSTTHRLFSLSFHGYPPLPAKARFPRRRLKAPRQHFERAAGHGPGSNTHPNIVCPRFHNPISFHTWDVHDSKY